MSDEFGTYHPDYYLSDGSVTFTTGGVRFRVHRSFFERESVLFRNLFADAANDTEAGPDPMFTLDVTPDEFACFLWVWYGREYSYSGQPKENWVTILRLAIRWHFDKIKELAIREIEALELGPAERISIYRDNGVEGERLLSSYVELCKSPSVPTEADARLLRLETLINVLQAREEALLKARQMGHQTPTSACLEDSDLREIVVKHFETGLGPRSSGTATGSGDQAPSLNPQHKDRKKPTESSTIIVGEPQVPGRKPQTDRPQPHQDVTPQTGSSGKGKQEKENRDEKKLTKAEEAKKAVEEQEKSNKETKTEQRRRRPQDPPRPTPAVQEGK